MKFEEQTPTERQSQQDGSSMAATLTARGRPMSDEAAHWVLGSGGPGCVSPRGDGSLGDEQMCRWSRTRELAIWRETRLLSLERSLWPFRGVDWSQMEPQFRTALVRSWRLARQRDKREGQLSGDLPSLGSLAPPWRHSRPLSLTVKFNPPTTLSSGFRYKKRTLRPQYEKLFTSNCRHDSA
jgi:hypothetical protein